MPAILESTSDSYQPVVLDKPILFVGRHSDCDLILNKSRKVSRKHCCLFEIEGVFLIRDLGSTNGIQVNSQKVTGLKELNSGDELTIGDCIFIFRSAQFVQEAQQAAVAPKKPIESDGDAPYRFSIEEADEISSAPNHELSSDIPILLDEPEDDGFDIGAGAQTPAPKARQKKRNRSSSDSQPELVAE